MLFPCPALSANHPFHSDGSVYSPVLPCVSYKLGHFNPSAGGQHHFHLACAAQSGSVRGSTESDFLYQNQPNLTAYSLEYFLSQILSIQSFQNALEHPYISIKLVLLELIQLPKTSCLVTNCEILFFFFFIKMIRLEKSFEL